MRKRKEDKVSDSSSPLQQIESYLKQNAGDHYNYEEERDYSVSSGSLTLDIEMGGGIKPGIIRASGVAEGGKTSCALSFARNFQKMKNSMVVYIKSEGRLSKEMIRRSGLSTDPNSWFVVKSNVYETVIDLIRHPLKWTPPGPRFMVICDWMDALGRRGKLEKSANEAIKVAGGALLSSDFLKRMALGLASRGHICFMISQVRSKVSINPYEKSDPKLTNASGGNALLHYSDWILEFQERYKGDMIFDKDGKTPIGHWCKVSFKKTTNEKTGILASYPICYGRTDGKSIWAEYEVVDNMLKFEMIKKAGAWVTVNEEVIEEVKKDTGEDFKQQHQGMDNLRRYFEENPKIGKYLFNKFIEVLKKS